MPKLFWVSWWSGNYADEGCKAPPFQCWNSGTRDRPGTPCDRRDEYSLCAAIEAESQEQIETALLKWYPDREMRFCEQVEDNWEPGDRFPHYERRTSLKGKIT